ncbi:MAG TPA: HEPN family nuclease, partial [Methylovirgula sp.]|nr:HEPN family nuclease [Methylovirgula sp.]
TGTNGPFEVTQLVNSFLGALVHPWENLRGDLNDLSISDAIVKGWPPIQRERPSDQEPTSLGDLIRLVRNGVAHGNIEFLPGPQGDIRALSIWNKDGRGRRTWGTIISTDDMRNLLICFVTIAEELYVSQGRSRSRIA